MLLEKPLFCTHELDQPGGLLCASSINGYYVSTLIVSLIIIRWCTDGARSVHDRNAWNVSTIRETAGRMAINSTSADNYCTLRPRNGHRNEFQILGGGESLPLRFIKSVNLSKPSVLLGLHSFRMLFLEPPGALMMRTSFTREFSDGYRKVKTKRSSYAHRARQCV